MNKTRLEAFSDGVIAILITIMVLEMKVPHGADFAALRTLWPVFLSYVLSFVYLGIYWNNHHHLMQVVRKVDGRVMWANLHLLFWLSLFPFVTAWSGHNHFAALPVALYGTVMLGAGLAYFILVKCLILGHGHDSPLAKAVGQDVKGTVSVLLYALAIPIAFFLPWLSCLVYVGVALFWFVPDRRMEKALREAGSLV